MIDDRTKKIISYYLDVIDLAADCMTNHAKKIICEKDESKKREEWDYLFADQGIIEHRIGTIKELLGLEDCPTDEKGNLIFPEGAE